MKVDTLCQLLRVYRAALLAVHGYLGGEERSEARERQLYRQTDDALFGDALRPPLDFPRRESGHDHA